MADATELKPPADGTETPLALRGDFSGWRSKGAARRRMSAELQKEVERDWQNFPNLPGLHLTVRKAGRGTWELVNDANGAVVVTSRQRRFMPHPAISYQGRTYEWRRLTKKMVARNPERGKNLVEVGSGDLVNVATGTAVLRSGGCHHDRRACARVYLTGRGELTFPVRGRTRTRALMSAIDESGNSLIQYRRTSYKPEPHFDRWGWTEVVIDPAASTIPQIELLVLVSSPWLFTYFVMSGGGGG